MSNENRIPVPAETLRRLVEGSVRDARRLREDNLPYTAESVQESASVVLKEIGRADGELVGVEESDLLNLTSNDFSDAGSEIREARSNALTFMENQHENH